MRNLKRALSLALASVMLLGMMVVGASAASYTDVDDKDNVEAIEVLNAVNVMIGRQGNFEPDEPVNRHEMAVIMAKLVLGVETADNYVGSHPFTDVVPWADKYVAACYENGLTSGTSATTYGGGNPLTAVQAAAMMLRALGYEDLSKGATDWRAPVTAAANRIRLFDGVASNPSEKLDRNQVAQLTLNTLKSYMVDTKQGLNITGSNGDYTFTINGDREYTARSSSKAFAKAIDATEAKGTSASSVQGYTIELGEHLYNGELKLYDDRSDAFGRPARYWEYKGEGIGTYAKDEYLRAQYTTEVTYKDLYELLGSSVVKEIGHDWSMDVVIDGVDSKDINPAVFSANKLSKTDKNTAGETGNGVLTQVYVDSVNKDITITIINTYLAKAKSDYDTKKESVDLTVYGVEKESDGSFIKNTSRADDKTANVKVYGEDFVLAESIKKGDWFLVNVADGSVQAITAADTVDSVKLQGFKKDDYVKAGGETYKYADSALYDVKVLEKYAESSNNLKDTTYKLYIDQYGYMIGIEIVEAKDNYVFITGYETFKDVLNNAEAKANAIFMDGTNKLITVKDATNVEEWTLSAATHGKLNSSTRTWQGNNGQPQLNQWYTYSEDSNGKYSLKLVASALDSARDIDVAQLYDSAAARDSKELNKSHPSLQNSDGSIYVYGNNDTVFLGAKLKTVNGADQIVSASTRTEGINNTSMKLDTTSYTHAGSPAGLHLPQGAYVLYDEDRYVIAAVVVGKNLAVSDNYAYFIGGVSYEGYNEENDDMWHWTRDAIINGEKVTLKERNDANVLEHIGQDKYTAKPTADNTNDGKNWGWYKVSYDAGGYVIDAEPIGWKTTGAPSADEDAVDSVVYFNTGTNTYDKEDVILVGQDMAKADPWKLRMVGQTLYVNTTDNVNTGIQVMPDAKAVLIQTLDGKEVIEYYDDDSGNVKAAIDDMESAQYKGQLFAVMKDGTASAVIIRDETNHKGDDRQPQLRTDIQIISTNSGNNITSSGKVLYTIEDARADVPSLAELQDALVAALKKEGCTDFSWDADKLTYTKANGTTVTTGAAVAAANFEWVYKLTVKNQGETETYYFKKDAASPALTGGAIYAVSAANAVSSPTLNMTVTKYNKDKTDTSLDNGTGAICNFAADSSYAYAAYNAAVAPKATHDVIIETGYVEVEVGGADTSDAALTNADVSYTVDGKTVSGDGTKSYAKAVTGKVVVTVTLSGNGIKVKTATTPNMTVASSTAKITEAGSGTGTATENSAKIDFSATVGHTFVGQEYTFTIDVARADIAKAALTVTATNMENNT